MRRRPIDERMPVESPPSKTCSNCNQSRLSSPFCPACGAPTFTPSGRAGVPAPPPAAAAPPSRKTPLWVKVLAIIGGLFVTMIVGCAALVGGAAHEVNKSLNDESFGDVSDASDASETTASFKHGVLRTPKMKIQITSYKIIGVGEKGNEYGEKPVIAFWYKTTNLSRAKVDPTDFILHFNAYQD